MFILAGNEGNLYVGYRLVLTFKRWELVRKHEVLGTPTARGAGTITFRSEAWVGEFPTKLELKIGNFSWTWLTFSARVEGDQVKFKVEGDPEIQ